MACPDCSLDTYLSKWTLYVWVIVSSILEYSVHAWYHVVIVACSVYVCKEASYKWSINPEVSKDNCIHPVGPKLAK